MKYFQMIWTPMLRAMLHYLVIKIILVAFFFSCKTSKVDVYKDKETYKVINALLDDYTRKNDSVYLHPKMITVKGPLIQNFLKTYTLKNIYFDSCGDTIKSMLFNKEALSYYETIKYEDKKWDAAKIKNTKVFTHLELKHPESIARYKRLSETIKDEYDLLDRKFMLWGLEHKEQMLKLSQPFFPKQDQDYAVCFGLELHEGDFIWIFHKKRKEWKLICKMRLNYH